MYYGTSEATFNANTCFLTCASTHKNLMGSYCAVIWKYHESIACPFLLQVNPVCFIKVQPLCQAIYNLVWFVPPFFSPASVSQVGSVSSALLPEGAKGLVFDCDGTLLDSMQTHFEAWRHTCKQFGIKLSAHTMVALAGE